MASVLLDPRSSSAVSEALDARGRTFERPGESVFTGVFRSSPPPIDVEGDSAETFSPSSISPAQAGASTATRDAPQRVKAPVVVAHENRAKGKVERMLESFEGVVTEVGSSDFKARLTETTVPFRENPQSLVAVFDIDEVSKDDRKRLQEGAVFYWSILTETEPYGTQKNVSELWFRRVRPWSKSEIAALPKQAEEMFGSFYRCAE